MTWSNSLSNRIAASRLRSAYHCSAIENSSSAAEQILTVVIPGAPPCGEHACGLRTIHLQASARIQSDHSLNLPEQSTQLKAPPNFQVQVRPKVMGSALPDPLDSVCGPLPECRQLCSWTHSTESVRDIKIKRPKRSTSRNVKRASIVFRGVTGGYRISRRYGRKSASEFCQVASAGLSESWVGSGSHCVAMTPTIA